MDPNTIVLLQVIAAFVQGLAAVAVIPITFYAALKGADRGAQRAYELNEQAARDRERREQLERKREVEQQVASLRLLLGLEIRQNLIDLEWLRDNLVAVLGEEQEQYYKWEGARIADAESYRWFEERQRFVTAHMPDWGHRFWYGQQASHLLPLALQELEIRQINFIHSQLDRLSKLRDMLTERARGYDKSPDPTTRPTEGPSQSGQFREDAPWLWDEFVNTLDRILALGNPLADNVRADEADYLPGATGRSRALAAAPTAERGMSSPGLKQSDTAPTPQQESRS